MKTEPLRSAGKRIMAVTLEELKQKLKDHVDETTLLEILDINSDELVERFEDKIDDRFDKLVRDHFDSDQDS